MGALPRLDCGRSVRHGVHTAGVSYARCVSGAGSVGPRVPPCWSARVPQEL